MCMSMESQLCTLALTPFFRGQIRAGSYLTFLVAATSLESRPLTDLC